MKDRQTLKTIDEYIDMFPEDRQHIITSIRQTIGEAAPEATEAIRYGMPTFRLNGNLVHFAVQKGHIGFYPTPSAIIKFKDLLENFSTSKGTIRFDLNQPIPHDLISKIVMFRVSEQKMKK